MDSQCMMNNCRAMCPDTEPFCAKHRGEPHNRTDWFAGDVDCDGNELITVRKDEWNTICEQREKFMWQVRDTCTRAENAEARAEALQADVARLEARCAELVNHIKDNRSRSYAFLAGRDMKGTDNAE